MIDFPSNPSDGDTHEEQGSTWVWRDPPGVWAVQTEPPTPPAPTRAVVNLGNLVSTGALSAPHGLTNPLTCQINFICVIPEYGYEIGDRIAHTDLNANTSTSRWHSSWFNDVECGMYMVNSVHVCYKNAAQNDVLTPGNWSVQMIVST